MIKKKTLGYLNYILKHKYYVMVECFRVGLIWRGIVHDLSKFYSSEWLPYLHYFYTTPRTKEIQSNFDYAWLYHQKRNKHHWQYWALLQDCGRIKCLKIPHKYVLEMICDWIGAGKSKGTMSPPENPLKEVRTWWETQRDKMQLHNSTRQLIETYLYRSLLG